MGIKNTIFLMIIFLIFFVVNFMVLKGARAVLLDDITSSGFEDGSYTSILSIIETVICHFFKYLKERGSFTCEFKKLKIPNNWMTRQQYGLDNGTSQIIYTNKKGKSAPPIYAIKVILKEQGENMLPVFLKVKAKLIKSNYGLQELTVSNIEVYIKKSNVHLGSKSVGEGGVVKRMNENEDSLLISFMLVFDEKMSAVIKNSRIHICCKVVAKNENDERYTKFVIVEIHMNARLDFRLLSQKDFLSKEDYQRYIRKNIIKRK